MAYEFKIGDIVRIAGYTGLWCIHYISDDNYATCTSIGNADFKDVAYAAKRDLKLKKLSALERLIYI